MKCRYEVAGYCTLAISYKRYATSRECEKCCRKCNKECEDRWNLAGKDLDKQKGN
jgi:hypothetical protein